ncbi:MAG: HDOD domain-containing protein [Deltaproteobacteria bacterium]|nr:HDOD domain-containing protein [Deltaproteobacteria bacterium]
MSDQAQSRHQIESFINRMPSLPTTVAKVIEVCNQPQTSPNDLNRLISLDPVLTGKVLKLINSAFFTLREPVTSVTRAIIMLGLNTVKNMALSTSIVGIFGGDSKEGCFSMNDFWVHSLAAGVTARMLAASKGLPADTREEYFVGGLLHDIGKIPMMHCFPEDYRHILRESQQLRQPLYSAEKETLGFDHCHVGQIIAEKWRLSVNLSSALTSHHQGELHFLARFSDVIAAANICAKSFSLGSAGDGFVEDPTPLVLKETGPGCHDLSQFQSDVAEELEKAKIFLDVSGA